MHHRQCFLFCRCVTPVSVPPAVYYAHQAAARGRCLVGLDDPSGSEASFDGQGGEPADNWRLEVNKSILKKMYYV